MHRKSIFLVAVVGLLLLGATPAFAHVAVDASDGTPGAELTTLTFRVPNEEDNASTVGFQVFLPTGVKFELVATQPMPGWAATTDSTKVTWTGGKIGPAQFEEFKIELGPLPKTAGSLTFKAIQTYDNGDIVRWIDATPANGTEPEHPAPVLTLTAADATSASSDVAKKTDVDQARTLGITAMAMALVAGFVAVRARRGGGASS